MDFLLHVLAYFCAGLIAITVGWWLASAFAKHKPLYDISFVNEVYYHTCFKTAIGSLLYGLIFMYGEEGIFNRISSFLIGYLIFGGVALFTDIKKYNMICQHLEVLEIETQEQFDELIKNGEMTNERK